MNAPARRYIVATNAKGKIRKVWGGRGPKTHEGQFLSDNKELLEQFVSAAVIIGDNHFSKGKKLLKTLGYSLFKLLALL